MKSMYTISEMAKYFNISNQTLHYYDKIGLLKPSFVHPTTRYRYYNQEQFNKMFLIVELKNVGFSLEEISALESKRNLASLEEIIAKNKKIITEKISALEKINGQMDFYLDVIDIVHHPQKRKECRIVTVPQRKAFYINAAFTAQELDEYVEMIYKAFVKATDLGSNKGLKEETTSKMILTMDQGNIEQGRFKYYSGIGLQVPASVTHRNVIEFGESLCATAIHVGSYDTLLRTYKKLCNYIKNKGYVVAGFATEISLLSVVQTENPQEFVTEIQIPVRVKD